MLLHTKLYIPPLRPSLVPRPRLIDRINQGMRRPLTLVAAPAGFGKTTLLSAWCAQSEHPAAWVWLDEGDNDPVRLWRYVIAALQTAMGGDFAAQTLQHLQSAHPPSQEEVVMALANDMAGVGEHFALVLDDYHAIEARAVHDALAFLIDHLPPQAHLIVATRVDPPLPVARWRVRDQVVEIRAGDLRFSDDEAALLLNQAMGLSLSAADVAALSARTEGWVAGLQLAALSMRGMADVRGFIAALAGSNRYIADYLTEEVLNRQPADVQSFMLQTAILDTLTAPLCDALTGREDGQAMLELLERNNIFLTALDSERQWYRYHTLFADLLRYRLRQADGERTASLHRRASAWYEQHGMIVRAVNHALAAQDYERAARLIQQNARLLLLRGELFTLQEWLDALPGEVVFSQPRLYLAGAQLLFQGVGVIERLLHDAERELSAEGESLADDERLALLGEIDTLRATVARAQEDIPHAIALSQRALEQLPAEDSFGRGIAAHNLAAAYRHGGDLDAAQQAFAEASARFESAGASHHALMAMCLQGDVQEEQGRLHQAAQLYRQVLRLAGQHAEPGGASLPVAGWALVGLGRILREWNDLEAADQHIQEGIRLGDSLGLPDFTANSRAALAHVRFSQGEVAGALALLQEADLAVRRAAWPRELAAVGALMVRVWLAQGELDSALHWVQTIDPGVHPHPAETLARARVWLAQGDADAARALLGRLREAGARIEALVLEAFAWQHDDLERALALLAEALTLAEPEGFVRLFVDEGTPMQALLSALGHRRLPTRALRAYVGRLLEALSPRPRAQAMAGADVIEPLTARELEVLQLMAEGLSNRDIASRLFVGVTTVKKHSTNIFDKLDVSNRSQAVARARKLGLIP